MRSLLLLFFASATTCEPAKAKQALGAAVVDTKLAGHWQGKLGGNGGDAFLHVIPHHGTQLDLVLLAADDKGGHVLHYEGQVNAAKQLSLRAKTFPDPMHDAFTLSPTWLIAKYAIAADGTLTLSWLEAPADERELANPAAYVASAEAKWQPLDATFKRK